MPGGSYNYIWRCAKCSCHFSNVTKMDGILKQEKKCPKCKSLNELTLSNNEIFIHCRFYNHDKNNYSEEFMENYPYVRSE